MNIARALIFGLSVASLAAGCGKGNLSGSGNGTGGNAGPTCSDTQTACGTSCVDTTSDATNCGVCGNACSGGQTCQSSQCQCLIGQLFCNSTCVASDATHCGSCATACPSGQVCSNNACTASCATGQTACGSSCVDTTSSAANCGSCGNACGSTQHCASGSCVANVTTGTGGSPATGGSTGTGGSTATGGATGTGGGSPATGGSSATGGSTGTGGSPAAQTGLVTSASGAYWNTGVTLTTVTSGNANVTVNDGTAMQTWEGFGGAFNEIGWLALSTLSASDRSKAIDLLFGSDAAHFDVGRIPIGASDYACALNSSSSSFVSTKSSCDFMKSRYTDDEGGTDPTMANFSITRDSQNLIPYVKAALQANPSLRLWASPWTPPTWMKTGPFTGTNGDGKTTMSNFDSGNMKSDASTLTAYALYLVTWAQAYGKQGITIESLSAQNEPSYAQDYPSCLWSTSLYTSFIGTYLGPAASKAGFKVLLGTMSNSSDTGFASAVMNDATAKTFPKSLGYQWSMEASVSGDKTKYSPLPIWQTEHRAGNYPFSGVTNPTPAGSFNSSMAPNDQNYGVETWELIREWINAGVTSYSAWNMVLDTVGLGIDTARVWPQDALLTVNTSSKALNVTPAYYVFRHLSQFAQPGAHVVATSGGEALAFKNPDGSIAVTMYNSGSSATYIVSVGGKKFQFSMPGNGWATVNYVP